MTSSAILSVDNLTLALDTSPSSQQLVRSLNLSLGRRKILALIGGSGCGKSLSCLSIMGLLPPNIQRQQGKIYLDKQRIDRFSPSQMRRIRGKQIAMILQNPMSCFDAIFKIRHHFQETLASHDPERARTGGTIARQALIEVGFEHPEAILEGYPFQMSGGMLQRVMVALALMMKVPVLIADEPTTDLDVVSQNNILDLLARMRTEHGMSILLITHDLSVVARLADDVAIMKDGSILENGRVEDIFNTCQHPYTHALIQAHLHLYGSEWYRLQRKPGGKNNDYDVPTG